MITKTLKKKEVELGFVSIPSKNKAELLGGMRAPFDTKLNEFPAKVDRQGRLWCTKYLKARFPINTEVKLTKTEGGFEIIPIGWNQKTTIVENTQIIDNSPMLNASGNKQVNDSTPILTSITSPENYTLLEGDCIKYLDEKVITDVNLTFFDPPYLQGKEYRFFDDSQSQTKYWNWIKAIVEGVYEATTYGGAIYFMHREKNAEIILRILRESGWNFQNLIIWKKKTSAVPIETRYSKQYQIIAYAIKGEKPKVFNKVRIDPPSLPWHKYQHENGVYLTDVWDDIRELTSGYFAGDEALRDKQGNRMHVQQTPVALLLRIILSSTLPGDLVFDPTAGTGTALVVAKQLNRKSVGVEIDPTYVELIKKRLKTARPADDISSQYDYYKYTPNLTSIWELERTISTEQKKLI